MIRQEPKLHFVYHNVNLNSFSRPDPVCQELDFVAFEDMHAQGILRINKNADLEIRLRRDGPPNQPWMTRGHMKIVLYNLQFEIEGSYPAVFCSDKPYHVIDLMSTKALKSEVGNELFDLDIYIKFDKWENLKVQKLFQFDHKYLDSNLNMCIQGHNFYVRSKAIFKEIPALQKYLEENFNAATTDKYEMSELQGEKSVPAFNTMLQVAYKCTFITNIYEVGELLTLAYRFDYPLLKEKCEYYLINEPESDWMQKLVFADLYDLRKLRLHVLSNTVGLAQVYKDLHQNRFLETDTMLSIMAKLCELKKQKMFDNAPPSVWGSLSLPQITENRWERLKREPLMTNAPEPDVTACFERFEGTLVPKHFGVDIVTPEFSFVEQTMDLFSYKVQLGPDHHLLFKIDWNNIQTGNFVWSVGASVFIRLQYQKDERWEYSERIQFNHDHQSIFFDGIHIQKVFPGGLEHLLEGLGSNPTLPKFEIMVVVESIKGLEICGNNPENAEEMDDEWILQPARTSPIVCCGKYLYVDKEVLRTKSRIFSKIFEQTYEPITIPMSFNKFDSFSSFLDILHGEEIFLDFENSFYIVEHARSFEVSEVLDRAIEFIIEDTTTTKIGKLELSVKYQVPELQKTITDSIVDVDELYEYLEIPNYRRRMCQILLDRLITLPIPRE